MIFFTKSSPLISMPVQVAGHYNPDGTYVKPHMRMQKVSMQPHQAHAHAASQKAEPTRLDSFIEKHGGAARMRDELSDMKPEQRAKLIDAMAHIDGIEPNAIMERLGMHDEAKTAPKAEPDKHEIVEHVTGKGKTLRGIVRRDLDKDSATDIDPYTFKKDGGWFIREKHLPAHEEPKEEPKVAEPAPVPEPEKRPEPKPEPKAEPRKLPDGWTGSVDGLITNTNPVHGGIIDRNRSGWFVIPQSDDIEQMYDLTSQQDAIDALAAAVETASEASRQRAIAAHAAMQAKSKDGTLSEADAAAAAASKGPVVPTLDKNGGLGLHVVKFPNGKFGYVGRVPDEIHYKDATPEQIQAGKQFGERFGPKKNTFDTATEAVAFAKRHGHDVESAEKDDPSSDPDGPKDGETKDGADGTLVFRDGRWHKQEQAKAAPTDAESVQRQELADALAKDPHSDEAKAKLREVAHDVAGEDEVPATEPDQHEMNLQKLRDKIEQMGGREQLAATLQEAIKLHGGLDTPGVKSQPVAVIDGLANALGLTRDDVLGELGLRERKVKRGASRPKVEPASQDIDDVDNPNSKNYRYADTGYVSGSRKELATAQQVIKVAKAEGARVYVTAINWEQIEQNPREAKDLITKSNLFGAVDWTALRDGGMDPGTGFIIDRIYAAIGTEPSHESPQARKDYTLGLQTLRDRLESCKTTEEVSEVLSDLQEEYDGTILNAEESAVYEELAQENHDLFREYRALDAEADPLYALAQKQKAVQYAAEHEIGKRKRRGWEIKPEHHAALADAKAEHDKTWEAWSEKLHSSKPRRDEISSRRQSIASQQRAIALAAHVRNKTENPLHRAWQTMGDRFIGVLRYRRAKGSDAFANHMASARAGKVKDWSWAEKEITRAPKITKEGQRFQLQVADSYERVGGRTVTPESTMELKDAFGLRDVQSGNWVLRDPVSAKFHTEQSAAAFADLADLLGADDKTIALNGRLALAFGARGTGNAGFGGAARAHYEPVQRVINLTKLGGGGALGHEWFHALDNMIAEAETVQAVNKDTFATETPEALPPGELRDAFADFRHVMWEGGLRISNTHAYTAQDHAQAKRVMSRESFTKTGPLAIIKESANVNDAVQRLDRHFNTEGGKESSASRRTKKISGDWKTLAHAHFGGNAEGGEIKVHSGKPMSSFALEATKLDGGSAKYWATTEEMAARAFQGWIEDRLADKGRRNDYLSAKADNKYYRDPLFGDQKPFPEGEERQRINAAIDKIVTAMQKSNTLQKALEMLGE